MQDTAQPIAAAETDAFADAAQAFKVELGQVDRPLPERDEQGRFASAQPEEPESSPEPDEEVTNATDEAEEAAEEAQPEPRPMPTSWSAEDAEIWETLPVEAQAKIADREAQRDHAVNAKFQEAANTRKAYEERAAATDEKREQVIGLMEGLASIMIPEEPPASMLVQGSYDYNPDEYHLQQAQRRSALQGHEFLLAHVEQLKADRDAEKAASAQAAFQEINAATLPALHRDIPELANDPSSRGPFMLGLVEYATKLGIPQSYFTDGPTPAVEWHVLWKAKQYDEGKAALAKAKQTPAPEPKRATPPVRPGVTTPRSTVQRQQRQKDFDRLSQTGSIADGAAVFKHFLR